MKSRCPNCQTVFRVTPEQLKARAGKVRCGQCQTVFNALDSLLDEKPGAPASAPAIAIEPAPAFVHPTAPAAPSPSVGVREPIGTASPTVADTSHDRQQEPSLDFEAPTAHDAEPDDAFFISAPANDEIIAAPPPRVRTRVRP